MTAPKPDLTAEDIRRYAAANRFDLSLERAGNLAGVVAEILSADAALERIDLSGFSPVGPLWRAPLTPEEASRE